MAKQSVELFDALETAIGDEVRARKKAGISRIKLATELEVKPGLLAQICQREGRYSISKMLDIAESMGIVVKFDIQ